MHPLPALTLADAVRLLASPGAFDAASPYLSAEAVAADEASAQAVLLKLAGQRRRDPRWRDVLLPLLAHDGLRATVESAIGRDPSREARDALFACVESGRSDSAAATLGALGDTRALPHLLQMLRRGSSQVHRSLLFPCLDNVIDGSAVAPLERWIAHNPTVFEVRHAKVLLQKAKSIAAGVPLPPPRPPDFDGFVPKLVAEAKKAVKALKKAHPTETVAAFAFDADPFNEFFAGCFDDAVRAGAADEEAVGRFRWHLFHEFGLAVSGKLPKGGLPPSPSVQDGYIEHFFRPILARACAQAVDEGVFAGLRVHHPFRVGYAYHSEPLTVCVTVP